jgi:hypothetical protein
MQMPTIRRMWTLYKRVVLQKGLGITRRNDVQVLARMRSISARRARYKRSLCCSSTATMMRRTDTLRATGGRLQRCGDSDRRQCGTSAAVVSSRYRRGARRCGSTS